MRKLLFILLLTLLVVQSCTTLKRCNAKFPPTIYVKDSLVYKDSIIVKDSLITIKGDEVILTTYIIDTLVFIDTVLQQGKTELIVKYRNGKLTAICKTDSLQLLINNLRRQVITASFNKTNTITKPIDRAVPYTPWYAKVAIVFSVFVVLMIAFIIWYQHYFNSKKN